VAGQWLYRDNAWTTIDFAASRRALDEAHAALARRIPPP
jgi:hypothetical protein